MINGHILPYMYIIIIQLSIEHSRSRSLSQSVETYSWHFGLEIQETIEVERKEERRARTEMRRHQSFIHSE